MDKLIQLENRIKELEKWKAEKEKQQISFPLDNQSIDILKKYFMRIVSSYIWYGGVGSINPPTNPSGASWSERKDAQYGSWQLEHCDTSWASKGSTGDLISTFASSSAVKTVSGFVFNKVGYTIGWSSSFSAVDYPLPTKFPVIGQSLDLNFRYNANISKWETYNVLDMSKQIAVSFDVSQATGYKYYFYHGLGKIPKKARIKTTYAGSASQSSESYGVMDNLTSNQCAYLALVEGTSTATSDVAGNNSTYSVMAILGSLSNYSGGVVTFDENYMILTLTKTGTLTGTAYLLVDME